jgi:putative DNA primase/helicase
MWRRILLVPFNHVIPKDKRDPRVKVLLRNPDVAGPAILAWLVQGCLKWQKSGLIIPEAIEKATGQYREELDPLKEFLEDTCEFAPDAFVPVMEMRAKYDEYAKASGVKYPLAPENSTSGWKHAAVQGWLRNTPMMRVRQWPESAGLESP